MKNVIHRTRRRIRLQILVPALIAVTVLSLCASYGVANTLDRPQDPAYVALGDSYSAGNGTRAASGECRRSDGAYGPLLAQELEVDDDFVHVACTDADTKEVRDKQIRHLGKNTTTVTLTAGGNDGQVFLSSILSCAIQPLPSGCSLATEAARKYVSTSLPKRLSGLYGKIARRLSEESIVLVGGYPIPYQEDLRGRECGSLTPTSHNRSLLNNMARHLNKKIRKEVEKASKDHPQRWEFVAPEFEGHELCTKTPWLHGPEEMRNDIKGAWHPNDAGHRRYASAFSRTLL